MKEIWKDVDNFEDAYECSNTGKVRSKTRWITAIKKKKNRDYTYKCTYLKNGREVGLGISSHGYHIASLSRQGKPVHTRTVHKIIAIAFLGHPINNKMQVEHKDGNRLNNKISNLKWVTAKENMELASINGQLKDRDNRVILTLEIAEEIRERYKTEKIGQFGLADIYGVTQSHIANIISGRTWNKKVRDGVISLDAIEQVKREYAKGDKSQEQIGDMFGFNQGTVSLMINKADFFTCQRDK